MKPPVPVNLGKIRISLLLLAATGAVVLAVFPPWHVLYVNGYAEPVGRAMWGLPPKEYAEVSYLRLAKEIIGLFAGAWAGGFVISPTPREIAFFARLALLVHRRKP